MTQSQVRHALAKNVDAVQIKAIEIVDPAVSAREVLARIGKNGAVPMIYATAYPSDVAEAQAALGVTESGERIEAFLRRWHQRLAPTGSTHSWLRVVKHRVLRCAALGLTTCRSALKLRRAFRGCRRTGSGRSSSLAILAPRAFSSTPLKNWASGNDDGAA
ncbi:hypothetical protein PSQ90_09280 [Devosia rhodophyticola]|uniref:Four-carbon acid sugar kinase nucleotide binding domain-containing protein n=1 Tax=Devosia rhodophyticola TaxID=3026423 RepID=A0ABY7YT96_9HYPH|nr:nucleotide-binding domain containing protein [Devosia rhodophyticola]WDR04529.1 hypothetical protein PSQ90_09280 [Devosia rhodophyticola]